MSVQKSDYTNAQLVYGKLVAKSDDCECEYTVSGEVGDLDHMIKHGADFTCHRCGDDHGFRFEPRDDIHAVVRDRVQESIDELDPIVNLTNAVDDDKVDREFMTAMESLHQVKFAADAHTDGDD